MSGESEPCTELASRIFATIFDEIVTVSSTQSAEMVKLLENTFRAVNVGLINEIALMCDRLGLDVGPRARGALRRDEPELKDLETPLLRLGERAELLRLGIRQGLFAEDLDVEETAALLHDLELAGVGVVAAARMHAGRDGVPHRPDPDRIRRRPLLLSRGPRLAAHCRHLRSSFDRQRPLVTRPPPRPTIAGPRPAGIK